MVDFPPEVWYHIALFLSKKTLRKCSSLNRTFFDVFMRLRYKSICICKWDMRDMRKLEWLREPFVRGHIRKLTLVIPQDLPPQKKFSLLPARHMQAKLPIFKRDTALAPRSDFLKSLLETVCSLHQLETVYICMCREKYVVTDDVRIFFSAMWKSVGSQLRSLHLRGTIHTFPYMIPSDYYLPGVEELGLEIVGRSTDVMTNALVDAVMQESISPLLSDLAPQLRALQINAVVFPGTMNDLSSLFRYLTTCPLLERLAIRWMAPSFKEASQLQRFLNEHGPNLTYFGLSLTVWNFQTDMLNRFLPECVAEGQSLQKITVLNLEPYPFNVVTFLEAARNIVRCCHNTLEALNLSQNVSVDEVSKILDIFGTCPRLSRLSLQVLDPNIQLFDELASRLPQLEQLTLYLHSYRNRSHLALAMRDLKIQLKSRSYTKWQLKDVSVYYRWKSVNPSMMKCISKAIPSVTSFWGEGDMDLHPSMDQWKDYHMSLHLKQHVMLSGIERGIERGLQQMRFLRIPI